MGSSTVGPKPPLEAKNPRGRGGFPRPDAAAKEKRAGWKSPENRAAEFAQWPTAQKVKFFAETPFTSSDFALYGFEQARRRSEGEQSTTFLTAEQYMSKLRDL